MRRGRIELRDSCRACIHVYRTIEVHWVAKSKTIIGTRNWANSIMCSHITSYDYCRVEYIDEYYAYSGEEDVELRPLSQYTYFC